MDTIYVNQNVVAKRCRPYRALWIVLGIVYLFALISVQAADRRTKSYNIPAKVNKAVEVVYQLSPFDLLKVTVYGENDLDSEQRISDKGMLSVPLLGEVSVGGLTVSSAAKRIESAFVSQQYLRHPIITISIIEFAPKLVTVLGEVKSPGSVEIPPGRNGIPVQIAIAGAGGFTGTAKTSGVNVTRAAAGKGKKIRTVVNVDKILKSRGGSSTALGFSVRPDDVVFVPRRVF